MPPVSRPLLISLVLTSLAIPAAAHLNDKEPMQSYRQSYFTLMGMNFGYIASMVKGEVPWDDAKLKLFAGELATQANMDPARAFPPGSEKGTTRAKPEIWDNMDDFAAKLEDLNSALAALKNAADSGDKEVVAAAVGDAGAACKACHDEYKSKTYLY